MKMADVVPVNVPLYQEINVHDVQQMFSSHKGFMMHLPDRMAKGRQIDRTYFFNVLNTLETEKLQEIIRHAQVARNVAQGEEEKLETIQISEEWVKELKEIPFKSSKSLHLSNSRRGAWQDDIPSQVEGKAFSGPEETQACASVQAQSSDSHASGRRQELASFRAVEGSEEDHSRDALAMISVKLVYNSPKYFLNTFNIRNVMILRLCEILH